MDEADIAADIEELHRNNAIRAARAQTSLMPTGSCLSCDADLAGTTRRFCDRTCADEWERHRAARRRHGKVE